ncbi:methyltransferase domain-containing protein [Candidatus Woesearchaeota archaeon]|nr:methyltransferase domain-containing protein [Candidatus Woesearchaeota archaeon]
MKGKIAVYSFSENVIQSFKTFIQKNFTDCEFMNYSSTNLNFFINNMLIQPPDLVVLTLVASSKALKTVPEEVFLYEHEQVIRPEYFAPLAREIASIVRMVKKALKDNNLKTRLLGMDHEDFTRVYLGNGVDFFLPIKTLSKQDMITAIRTGLNNKVAKQDINLVYEKQEFYNMVAAHNVLRARARKTADTKKEVGFLVRVLTDHKCKTVLDAGCGEGRLSIPLAIHGFKVVGIDISEVAINNAKMNAIKYRQNFKHEPEFYIMDIFDLNFNTKFDAAILMWHVVCDFRTRLVEALNSISNVLKHGGVLIFDFPDISNQMNVKIDKNGVYKTTLANGFKKYVGLVLPLETMLKFLELNGFKEITYHKVKWGIPKFVIVAKS